MKSMIKAKLETYVSLELLLLQSKGYISSISSDSNTVNANSNFPAEAERYYSSSINETFGRGSPSLAGRGIANPMSERTRGFEFSV
jgi:hypothetical protein